MSNESINFPFDLIKVPSNGELKEPFISKVESALRSDLQDESVFGCRICDCHTHAGSKMHFYDFTEAELLFHNNYYNDGFAELSVRHINEVLEREEYKNCNNVLFIGYENFSELFLQSLKYRFNIINENKNRVCDYCVYEVYVDGDNKTPKNRITRLKFEVNSEKKPIIKIIDGVKNETKFDFEKTLFVYIVPINTTLSTMDKMVAKFKKELLPVTKNEISGKLSYFDEFLCLITLSGVNSAENRFFKFTDKNMYLEPVAGKFEFINKNVRNLVDIKVKTVLSENCEKCFPDKNNGQLIDEAPVFGVNRGSVVPMLRVGIRQNGEPLPKEGEHNNLIKVWRLSDFMVYNHIVRSGNHFQYYFFTERFLDAEKKRVEQWLDGLKDKIFIKTNETQTSRQIFDYLIAPRHSTNSLFVYLVNKNVFDEQARIIYFDVDKEYRENLKAKYSDFLASWRNIKSGGIPYLIRFHYVDDSINSGSNFLRAKNLLMSLTENDLYERQVGKISLFNSAILLINRSSIDTIKFYMSGANIDNFFSYVNVKISAMRNFDDACTLCRLAIEHRAIKEVCATNRLAEICDDVIDKHQQIPFDSEMFSGVTKINFESGRNERSRLEKRYVFYIAHLLNERLSGNEYFSWEKHNKTDKHNIKFDYESNVSAIKNMLEDFYGGQGFYGVFKEEKLQIYVWRNAFIKAISRPFFINHIRLRQAAFSFCLNKLNDLLFKTYADTNEVNINDSMLIKVLVKALADMNANYIMRKDVLIKLVELAKESDKLKVVDGYEKNRIFGTDSLLVGIKKNLVLSRDSTKSLLLEHILLNNDEQGFFEEAQKNEQNVSNVFFDNNGELTIEGKLYFENNIILNDILCKKKNLEKLLEFLNKEGETNADTLYFFDNFKKIWKINRKKDLVDNEIKVFEAYSGVISAIQHYAGEHKHENKKQDFSNSINNLFNGLGVNELQAVAFFNNSVHDGKRADREWFRYLNIAKEPSAGETRLDRCKFGDLKTTQAIFYEDNISNLNEMLYVKEIDKGSNHKEYIKLKTSGIPTIKIIKNVFINDNETQNESVIIRYCLNEHKSGNNSNNNKDKSNKQRDNTDKSIYLQIWGFDRNNAQHVFALKILLTLRNTFVEAFKNNDLQETIEKRRAELKYISLQSNKASTHDNGATYLEDKVLEYNYDKYDIKYNHYLQLLADEQISSLYRKIIKDKDNFFCNKNKGQWGVPANRILKHINNFFGKSVKDETSYKLIRYEREKGDNVDCILKFKNEANSGDCFFPKWNDVKGGDFTFIYITCLLALNCLKHANTTKYQLDIIVRNDEIEFKNKYVYQTDVAVNIEKSGKIPPFVFEDKEQHLTLWTLKHADYSEEDVEKSKNSYKCFYELQEGNEATEKYFSVKFKLFKKLEKE